jgi:hypothetical protein
MVYESHANKWEVLSSATVLLSGVLAIAWSDATDATDATDDTVDTVDCITQLHTLIPGPAALLYYSWGVKQ